MTAPRSWYALLLVAFASGLGCNDLLGVEELSYSEQTCDTGRADCDGDAANGCEVALANDGQHCGKCATACVSSVCRDSVCLTEARYGNTGPGTSSQDFGDSRLAGVQIYVAEDCVLTKLGVVLSYGALGVHMVVGLYKDEAGKPTKLLATVAQSFAASAGGMEVDVSPGPVELNAGNYWLMGVWDQTAKFATNGTTVPWLYSDLAFGPLPATAPLGMSEMSLKAPNVYAVVAQ